MEVKITHDCTLFLTWVKSNRVQVVSDRCQYHRPNTLSFVDLLNVPRQIGHAAYIEPLLDPSLSLFVKMHPPIAGKFSTLLL
jgi:hypothetical protein